jgi:hypothetical protein
VPQRLDYAKQRRRDIKRAADHSAKRPAGDGAERQAALQAFVDRWGLRCFKCNTDEGPWAKTGHGASRQGDQDHLTSYSWAICASCVNKRSASEG